MDVIALLAVIVPVCVGFGYWFRGRDLRRPLVTLGRAQRDLFETGERP